MKYTFYNAKRTLLVNVGQNDSPTCACVQDNLIATTNSTANIRYYLFQKAGWSMIAMSFMEYSRFRRNINMLQLQDMEEQYAYR